MITPIEDYPLFLFVSQGCNENTRSSVIVASQKIDEDPGSIADPEDLRDIYNNIYVYVYISSVST